MKQTLERNGQPVSLVEIYRPITDELRDVEAALREELKSDLPWIDQLLEHSRLVGGKRMRPVFLLLSGACCGELGPGHLHMATALEMIHTASLIHDDVLDHAETRRHVPTANSRWGNKVSVLLGDYLFTHAFCVASKTGSSSAVHTLAAASNRVCAGEMRQNAWAGNFELSEPNYIRMISEKTGELVGCGCRLGAILSGADDQTVEAFSDFGLDLGVAFQIIDDILDLVGSPDKVGKTLGTDLTNRKPTLPVIHALQNLPPNQREQLIAALGAPDVSVETIMPFLTATESIDYARDVAAHRARRAIEFATSLPESKYSTALTIAAEFILQRSH